MMAEEDCCGRGCCFTPEGEHEQEKVEDQPATKEELESLANLYKSRYPWPVN